jgi:hypothetical protein
MTENAPNVKQRLVLIADKESAKRKTNVMYTSLEEMNKCIEKLKKALLLQIYIE